MRKLCPLCWGKLEQIEGTDYRKCSVCDYNEHREEVKAEILYIVEYALTHLQNKCNDNIFGVPNGSTWTYEEVIQYLKESLK